MHSRKVLMGGVLIACVSALALSDESDPIQSHSSRVRIHPDADTPITVEIQRARFTAITQGDLPHRQALNFASIEAGGRQIELDWSRSRLAERELIRNATLNHGDFREPRATVRGALEFRTRRAAGNDRAITRELDPVIVLESIKIELVPPGENRRESPLLGIESWIP